MNEPEIKSLEGKGTKDAIEVTLSRLRTLSSYSSARARVLYAVQGRISATLFASKTAQAAWKSKPTWYAVSTQDRTTSPELERFLANRMKATTIELKSSHVSLLSHPQEIADLILTAAGH